jgi:hypothetical protein
MNTTILDEERTHAIAALDVLLQEYPQNLEKRINEATQCLVHLRNGLIALGRGSQPSQPCRDQLSHVNAAISVLMAGHYPLEGMRWDCIKAARDALSALGRARNDRHF